MSATVPPCPRRAPSVPQGTPKTPQSARAPVPPSIRHGHGARVLDTESTPSVRRGVPPVRGGGQDARPSITFASWLRRQRRRDDAVGDLARDLVADPLGPADEHPSTVLDYVAAIGAEPARAACRAAVREWQAATEADHAPTEAGQVEHLDDCPGAEVVEHETARRTLLVCRGCRAVAYRPRVSRWSE